MAEAVAVAFGGSTNSMSLTVTNLALYRRISNVLVLCDKSALIL